MIAVTPPLEAWLAAADRSHDRLVRVVGSLSPDQVAGPSYPSEWSVAQVLSHLGSGAEIFTLFLEAGLEGGPSPGPEVFGPVWERWDAKPPGQQATDSLAADRTFLDRLEALSAVERREWRLAMFGADQSLGDVLRMRVSEHALHTWDIAVTRDPAAEVEREVAALLVDQLDQLVARVGQSPDEPLHLQVVTRHPDRRFLLTADSQGAELLPLDIAEVGDDPTLELPAEALIRLVYGRMDPAHTPPLLGDTGEVARLRLLFPGF